MVDLLGLRQTVGFMRYGERLKKTRAVLRRELNDGNIKQRWDRHMSAISVELLEEIMAKPDTFYDAIAE